MASDSQLEANPLDHWWMKVVTNVTLLILWSWMAKSQCFCNSYGNILVMVILVMVFWQGSNDPVDEVTAIPPLLSASQPKTSSFFHSCHAPTSLSLRAIRFHAAMLHTTMFSSTFLGWWMWRDTPQRIMPVLYSALTWQTLLLLNSSVIDVAIHTCLYWLYGKADHRFMVWG